MPAGADEPGVLWRFPTGGRVAGAATVTSKGPIVVASEDRFLYFLDPGGSLIQKIDLVFRPGTGPTVGADGSVYIVGRNGLLKAFNPAGGLIWEAEIGGPPASAALAAPDGTVIACTTGGLLTARSHNGLIRWRRDIGENLSGEPVISTDGLVLVPAEGGYLYAFDVYGGEQYRFLTAGKPGTPFPAAGGVACGTAYGTVFLLNGEGKLLWNRSYSDATGVLYRQGDVLCVRTGETTLRGMSPAGEDLWRHTLPGYLDAAAGCGDGVVFFGSAGMAFVDAGGRLGIPAGTKTGEGRWSAGPGGTVLHAGENWVVTCVDPLLAGVCGPEIDFNTAGGGEPGDRRESVDYNYLAGVTAGVEEELISAALREFEALAEGSPPQSIPPYTEEILRRIASGAVTKPVYLGKNVINDFPILRARAARLLALYGTPDTSKFLLSLLPLEWDSLVTAEIIETLGFLGRDASGEVVEGIYRALNEAGGRDSRLATAALNAVDRITGYHGHVTSPRAVDICLTVFRGEYPRDLRRRASQLLLETGR